MIRRATIADTAHLAVPMGKRLDWRSAATARLRPVANGDAPPTTVALLADPEALTVRFTCRATRLTARMMNDGDPLYLEDVVEVFLAPGGDPSLYLEYEVSPLGRDLCLLCCQRDGRVSRWRPWGALPEAKPTCTVTVQGGPQQPLAAIRSWTAELRIPFAALAGIADVPTAGTTWRANCYRIDHGDGGPRHLAWSPPPVADFHQLDSFGSITFTGRP